MDEWYRTLADKYVALQHAATRATRCNTFQRLSNDIPIDDYCCGRARHCQTLHDTATHCTTLQHTARHCKILQHTATHYDTLQHAATTLQQMNRIRHLLLRTRMTNATHCNTLQHAGTYCTTMQQTATLCDTLQQTATACQCIDGIGHLFLRTRIKNATQCNKLQQIATHCNTIQHIATHCMDSSNKWNRALLVAHAHNGPHQVPHNTHGKPPARA